MRSRSVRLPVALVASLAAVGVMTAVWGADWPSFRGPAASGVAEGERLPLSWSVKPPRHVAWKTGIPGLGHSSPIVTGERVFITTAVSGSEDDELKVGLYGNIRSVEDKSVHEWRLYCLDRPSGKILWSRSAHKGVPRVKRHPKSTHANSTPATDGRHVVTLFGSEGLYCYDLEGKLLWKKDLGVLDAGFFQVPEAQWGYGASPVIHGGKVIVQCDIQKGSFLAAFDVKDGRELWRTPRADVPTWSSPAVYQGNGRAQVIVNGWKHVGGYDLASGRPIWRMTGGGDIPVPTPVLAHGLVFITNAHGPGSPVYAIRLQAQGDISLQGEADRNEFIAWSVPRGGAYMQTPLVYGDYLYVCRDNGVLSCYRAKTGERIYQERLGDGRTGFSASAVAGDGKIYYTSEMGEVYVVRAGPQFEILAKNDLDEVAMATPAITRGMLIFRTRRHVVAVR